MLRLDNALGYQVYVIFFCLDWTNNSWSVQTEIPVPHCAVAGHLVYPDVWVSKVTNDAHFSKWL